jgi:acyl-CoA thioesterase FadM
MTYAVGRRWTFSPRFYQRAAVHFPMVVHWSISRIGNSSFDLFQSYYEPYDSQTSMEAASPRTWSSSETRQLATSVSRFVNIDPVTRKPVSLPTDFIKSAIVVSDSEQFPEFRPPTEIPSGAFSSRIRVRYDDTDAYGHTNVSSYLRFVSECASRAAESGFYSKIARDIAFYPVKSSSSVYIVDSRAQDNLDVSTWEDVDNKMLLNFTVGKQGKMICYSQIEYYENNVD